VQVNNNPSIPTLKAVAGLSIAMYRAPYGKEEQSGSVIKSELIKDLESNRGLKKYAKDQRAAQASVVPKPAPTNTAKKDKDEATETNETKDSNDGKNNAAATVKQNAKGAKLGVAAGKSGGASGGKGYAVGGKGGRKK
jgi:hypothetical protein